MNKSTALLTIAIPTYNRCEYLKECLDSIYKEIDTIEKKDAIEIIISDNASQDNTGAMLQEKYPEIEYHRNLKNYGVEYNVDKCYAYARGKYTWIFPDDDIMLPGALSEILNVIEMNPDFIHLNTVSFHKKFKDLRHCSGPRLKIKKNIVTKNKDHFLELVNIFITFLTSSVYKTEFAQAVDRSVYDGSFTSSAQTVLLSMANNGKYAIVAKPCAAARGGNTGGYNLYTVWVKGYKDLILGTGKKVGISNKTLRKVYIDTMMKYVRKFILEFRTTQSGLTLNYRYLIFYGVKEFPSLWIPLVFATYAPISLLKLLDES